MTPQEAQMLEELVRKVEGTQLTEKDPDADALLNDGLARDPDAIYKLAQTVLIQNLALEQAHGQLQRMQQQPAPPPPARATSFLGGLLHHSGPQAAAPAAAAPPQWQAVPPSYAVGGPAPGYASPGYGGGSAGGGFLRSAATTAAGVAGGMLAFEGIESLMHGGLGGGLGGYGGGMPVEETVVNNYYEEPSQQGAGSWQGGPDEQPQGPLDAGAQDQGNAQDFVDDAGGDDTSQDAGQDFVDDSGGGDFGDGGGDGSDFV